MTVATAISPQEVESAYAACEKLAGRDKPHLYAAAALFGRSDVRRAFVATYASMRLIDDAVDSIPDRASLSEPERARHIAHVGSWLDHVRSAKRGEIAAGSTWAALADTFAHFDFPLNPWIDLAAAMSADVRSSGFRDWEQLRRYMMGASVAPAVVFMHLVLMRPDSTGVYRTSWPYSKVLGVTEDLAIFCYWVHILRDVAEDLSLGGAGLLYLPEADLRRFSLTADDLHAMRESRRSSDSYRRLAAFEATRAFEHLRQGRMHWPEILAESSEGNGRALVTLVETYERVLTDLQDRDFDVFSSPL